MAWADVGTYCTAWNSGGLSGSHQKPCYDRNADNTIRGIGKAYVDNNNPLDQLSLSVQLQRAVNDGNPNNWSNIASDVCGWTDNNISESSSNPNTCRTVLKNVVAPGTYVYRTRVQVTIFYSAGGWDTSSFTYSGLTT